MCVDVADCLLVSCALSHLVAASSAIVSRVLASPAVLSRPALVSSSVVQWLVLGVLYRLPAFCLLGLSFLEAVFSKLFLSELIFFFSAAISVVLSWTSPFVL